MARREEGRDEDELETERGNEERGAVWGGYSIKIPRSPQISRFQKYITPLSLSTLPLLKHMCDVTKPRTRTSPNTYIKNFFGNG